MLNAILITGLNGDTPFDLCYKRLKDVNGLGVKQWTLFCATVNLVWDKSLYIGKKTIGR